MGRGDGMRAWGGEAKEEEGAGQGRGAIYVSSSSGPLGSLDWETQVAPGRGALDDARLTNKPQSKQRSAISKEENHLRDLKTH